jgi:hypothetical protein
VMKSTSHQTNGPTSFILPDCSVCSKQLRGVQSLSCVIQYKTRRWHVTALTDGGLRDPAPIFSHITADLIAKP